MSQIIWYLREQIFAKKPKKTQESLKEFNELINDDIDDDLSDGDGVNMDEIINDLE